MASEPKAPLKASTAASLVGFISLMLFHQLACGTATAAPARALVFLGNLVQTFDGTGKIPSITTVPSGLPVSLTYDGTREAPSNTGSYTVWGVVTDPRYLGSAKDTFTITPSITNVAGPANGIYKPSQSLEFLLNCSGPLSVLTNGGIPAIPLTIGSNARQADYVSGDQTNVLLFRYQIHPDDIGAVALGTSISLNGALLVDSGGHDLVRSFDPPDLSKVFVEPAVVVDVSSGTLQLQALASGRLLLTINGAPGATYVVQTADELASPAWRYFGSTATDANGSGLFELPTSEGAHFFRTMRPMDAPPR